MSFQPILPASGYLGWMFLNRTLDDQKQAYSESPIRQREIDYFRDKIGQVTSAEQLVSDRRLLAVALGAFGLDGDIDNRFYIRKVLEDGTRAPDALANRLADKTYRTFSAQFGFGEDRPATQDPGFADKIVAAYQERQFEVAVGESNDAYRLALNAQRELATLAPSSLSDDGKWYTVMGSPPLRSLFETALGLPSSLSNLELEDQLENFREKTEQQFGVTDLSEFGAPEKTEELIQRFLLKSELNEGLQAASSSNVALTLLSQASAGSR